MREMSAMSASLASSLSCESLTKTAITYRLPSGSRTNPTSFVPIARPRASRSLVPVLCPNVTPVAASGAASRPLPVLHPIMVRRMKSRLAGSIISRDKSMSSSLAASSGVLQLSRQASMSSCISPSSRLMAKSVRPIDLRQLSAHSVPPIMPNRMSQALLSLCPMLYSSRRAIVKRPPRG